MTTATGRVTTDAALRTIHRRPEPFTSGWEARSACYNRPEAWWDGEDAALTAKARAVCTSCPVLAECLAQVMKQEKSVLWSRSGVRGGLTGPDRMQLFLDEREYGPYDAEEARLLALEGRVTGTPVAADDAVSKSTLQLARRLAGENVPARKPPSATELRGGTAKERAFARAQDILEWRAAGMTTNAIAAELQMGRETVQDVLNAYAGITPKDQDDAGNEQGGALPQELVEFLNSPDTRLPDDMKVLAIADAVRRGMSYPDIDRARKVRKGYTATFVSRQRKRYERAGREFPVKPVSPRVLTDEQVVEMRERYARGGVTDLELSLHYGVPRNVVSNALNGRNYRDVGGPIRPKTTVARMPAVREHMCGHAAKSKAALNKSGMEKAA